MHRFHICYVQLQMLYQSAHWHYLTDNQFHVDLNQWQPNGKMRDNNSNNQIE